MRRAANFLGLALAVGALSGCVERRFVVTTDPPGALVLRNNQPIGAAPADDHFVYYGAYDFTIVKPGYETLHVHQEIPTPWYEWWPLDFVSENLVPWNIEDVRRFHYALQPLQPVNVPALVEEGQNLRNRAQTLGPPKQATPPGAPQPELAPTPTPFPDTMPQQPEN